MVQRLLPGDFFHQAEVVHQSLGNRVGNKYVLEEVGTLHHLSGLRRFSGAPRQKCSLLALVGMGVTPGLVGSGAGFGLRLQDGDSEFLWKTVAIMDGQ